MSFVNPILAGLGLAFIALPIILHFLRRKRKPIQWGAMRFLIEAYKRKRRRMTLEQFLLLASRVALVALIALFIGRPILGSDSLASGPRDVYIVLDDSIASSITLDHDHTEFQTNIRQALAMLDSISASAGDRVGLIRLGAPAQAVVSPASSDLISVRRLIETAQPVEAGADLAGAFEALSAAIQSEDPKAPPVTVAIFSTFRRGSADPDHPLPKLAAADREIRIVATEPATAPADNVAVISVEPLRGIVLGERAIEGQAAVTLRRFGPGVDSARRIPVTLELLGIGPVGRGEALFEPGATEARVMVMFSLPPEQTVDEPVLIAKIGDDALNADNLAARPIDRRRSLRVGVLASRTLVGRVGLDRFSPADWVRLALAPTESSTDIHLIDVTPALIDAPRLASLDAVILLEPDAVADDAWPLLRRFVDRDGLLIVTPPDKDSVHLWTDAMTSALGLDWTIAREPVSAASDTSIDPDTRPADDPLLAMIAGELGALAAPVTVQKILPITSISDEGSIVLRLSDGTPLLSAAHPLTESGRASRGLVIYLAVPPSLGWTNLPTRPVMVPIMQELVRQGVGLSHESAVRIAGRATDLPGSASEAVDTDRQPVDLPLRKAGVYELLDAQREHLGRLAVNPDTGGVDTNPIPKALLEPWLVATLPGPGRLAWITDEGSLQRAGSNVGPAAHSTGDSKLVFWLIIAALCVAILETALARWAARSMQRPHHTDGSPA